MGGLTQSEDALCIEGNSELQAEALHVDRRMRSNREYGPNDNNCWVFMTRGIQQVMRRAQKNGATVVMEPYPPVSRMGMVVGKFRDPAGNQIELTEVGTDDKLYLQESEE